MVKKELKTSNKFLMIPMCFMLVTTAAAPAILIRGQFSGGASDMALIAISVPLMGLAALVVREAIFSLRPGAA